MAITASEARRALFPLIEKVNDDRSAIEITSKRGNAVLMSAEDTRRGRRPPISSAHPQTLAACLMPPMRPNAANSQSASSIASEACLHSQGWEDYCHWQQSDR